MRAYLQGREEARAEALRDVASIGRETFPLVARVRFGLRLTAGIVTCLLVVPVLPASTSDAKPDIVAGEKLFAACAACHAPELPTRTGPDLRKVVGRRAGSVSGFRYSRVLKNAGVVWNDATLDAFLAEPQAVFPGNAMPFPGLPDAEQRLHLIAYLKTLN